MASLVVNHHERKTKTAIEGGFCFVSNLASLFDLRAIGWALLAAARTRPISWLARAVRTAITFFLTHIVVRVINNLR